MHSVDEISRYATPNRRMHVELALSCYVANDQEFVTNRKPPYKNDAAVGDSYSDAVTKVATR